MKSTPQLISSSKRKSAKSYTFSYSLFKYFLQCLGLAQHHWMPAALDRTCEFGNTWLGTGDPSSVRCVSCAVLWAVCFVRCVLCSVLCALSAALRALGSPRRARRLQPCHRCPPAAQTQILSPKQDPPQPPSRRGASPAVSPAAHGERQAAPQQHLEVHLLGTEPLFCFLRPVFSLAPVVFPPLTTGNQKKCLKNEQLAGIF